MHDVYAHVINTHQMQHTVSNDMVIFTLWSKCRSFNNNIALYVVISLCRFVPQANYKSVFADTQERFGASSTNYSNLHNGNNLRNYDSFII